MDNAREQPAWGALTVKDVVDAPPALLQEMRQTAYNLYQAERYEDAQKLLKGVLAVESKDAWSLGLYATMLRKQNQFKEALVLLETAHGIDPANENIRKMREELLQFARAVQEAKQNASQ